MLVRPLTFAIMFINHFPHLNYLSTSRLRRPWEHAVLRTGITALPHGEFRASDVSTIEQERRALHGIILEGSPSDDGFENRDVMTTFRCTSVGRRTYPRLLADIRCLRRHICVTSPHPNHV